MAEMSVAEFRSRATRILADAAISDVRLHEMECKAAHPTAVGPYDVSTDIAAKGEQRGSAIDCFMSYDVRACTENTDQEAWRIQLKMVGTWGLNPEVEFDYQDIAAFAIAIGSMTIHPYARECIQSAVSRLGYPPFTLDMLPAPTAGDDGDILQFDVQAEKEPDQLG